MKLKRILLTVGMTVASVAMMAQVWQYVDPRIGSEGVGRTFPGPSMPFGLCKPGPDCTVKPNAGWAPMPEVVTGFSQTHVSGTGGGQKYGNVLIQPFMGNGQTRPDADLAQRRKGEEISLGYYATTYENGIHTEITASERCAFYRIHYPSAGSLLIDATHYLGKDSVPDGREKQQFVGAEVEVTGSHEVVGFTRIRGGWNNGDAYTVYFCLQSDKAFKPVSCADGRAVLWMNDSLHQLKVGISYVSTQQARRNIPECDFDKQLDKVRESWEQLLSRIQVKGTERDKRMFYTALYHTMLMPVEKTGENPKWTETPYYDDFYAIWDTYRTSTPLITLMDEQREVDIVNSLLNIYKREAYLPDARSGDCNGRTQGGSNAEVVIADAFVKGLKGIDYHLALEAMLKDADADPGADHEKHGRGGLTEYNSLGYLPYGIDRAGNRTVEYAYDDFCIAQVAKGLGREDLYERFIRQSQNWKNLWRADYEWDDVKGYIMPRDAKGHWLDSVPWGRSKVFHPMIPYTPVTKVAPWYLPWWSTFFDEALSA
jgi:predicted alpha-1,2-mannosidase